MSNEELSIDPAKNRIDLHAKSDDRKSAALRIIVGYTPVIGPILSEIVNDVIPNQKIERIATFCELLDGRLRTIEVEILEEKMKSAEATLMLEEAFAQASKAQSKERLEYLANLFANSLADEALAAMEKQKLLNLLGELNDAEIIHMKYRSLHGEERSDFHTLHFELLQPLPSATFGDDSPGDRRAMQDSYKQKLSELGLIVPEYKMSSARGDFIPEFDRHGRMKIARYEITRLGRLLLQYIENREKAEEV